MKLFIIEELEKKNQEIKDRKYQNLAETEKIDVTAQFPSKNLGHKHPISIAWKIIEDIFISM
ncbi:MAG: hypothetical protein LBU14_06665 [Candidatus Peribacteria bacterium]|nr:hypothetical protein [Candidatus Peribacteria bacterium]